mgnify:FL=1
MHIKRFFVQKSQSHDLSINRGALILLADLGVVLNVIVFDTFLHIDLSKSIVFFWMYI